MKRLIAALVVGWGLIYATNHLLLPRAPAESKVAVQSEQSTDLTINSWGPYLPHVKHLEPNNTAETSLQSRQTQEPAASEDGPMQLSSRDIIEHAEAVALEERNLQVARVGNPRASAAYQHDGSQSSLQDLKPNSEAVALEERTLRVARVKNPPMAALRQHDGILLSSPNLKPNLEANAPEDRTLQVARVENPPTVAAYQHDGIQLASPDLNPNSEVVASAERTLQVARVQNPQTTAGRQHDGIQSSSRDNTVRGEDVATAERISQEGMRPDRTTAHPITSRKTRGTKSGAYKARVAEVSVDHRPSGSLDSAHQRRGLGLFIFAPPGF
jgi:hypothetical protein